MARQLWIQSRQKFQTCLTCWKIWARSNCGQSKGKIAPWELVRFPLWHNPNFLVNCLLDSRPAESEMKVKPSGPGDAAALIAEALKRKFAHCYRRDSEREEREDFTIPVRDRKPQTETPVVRLNSCDFLSEGGVRQSPLSRLFQFGQHMLKETGRRTLIWSSIYHAADFQCSLWFLLSSPFALI